MSQTPNSAAVETPRETAFSWSTVIPLFAVFAILAAFAFAGRSVFVKAGAVGISLPKLMALQSALSLPILWGIAKLHRNSLMPKNAPISVYTGRIFWGIATTALTYWALSLMPAALASTLGYTSPLFMAVLAPLFLNERSSRAVWALTGVGFGGIFLNAVPYLNQVPLWAIGLGLCSGIAGTMLQIYTRKLSAAGESSVRGVFWLHVTTALLGLAWCIGTDTLRFTTAEMLAGVVLAGLSCLAQVCNASAYAHGRALPVNALSLLTLPLTVVMASMFMSEHVSLLAIVGIGIALPACFMLVWVEHTQLRDAHDKAHDKDHDLTREELAEEHAQVQAAFGAVAEPLLVTKPSAEELAHERAQRRHH